MSYSPSTGGLTPGGRTVDTSPQRGGGGEGAHRDHKQNCWDGGVRAHQACHLCPHVSQPHLQTGWNPVKDFGQWIVSKSVLCHGQVRAAKASMPRASLPSPSTESSEMTSPQCCLPRPGPRATLGAEAPVALAGDVTRAERKRLLSKVLL